MELTPRKYTTLYDLENFEVRMAIPDEYINDYNVQSIAREISEYDGIYFTVKPDYLENEDKFWEVCMKNEN